MEIALADAVGAVREQLLEAVRRAEGEDLVFEVGPIELEFSVQLRKEGQGKFGVKVFAVSAEAGGGISKESTHRIQVTLVPQRSDGSDVHIAGSARKDGQADRPRLGR
ncbi:trypco2 family protein [Streptosporangium pseudovulgare]|uniref:Trypsin-co-occurring domain-containing protein n=1 Tax=Streptosporangium pseudovulgare TaxID=35765 RepID=A0ABQ2R1P2_9ACTN|nr:trypco2 family protein [Streptosporangium pseudovulgare]GGQ08992.1 hypothetical protein GCM10010140_43930 [Streptosporangium pseudovulgare]